MRRHRRVVVRMIGRHEALIAPEQVRLRPGKRSDERRLRKSFVQAARRAAAGKRKRERPALRRAPLGFFRDKMGGRQAHVVKVLKIARLR